MIFFVLFLKFFVYIYKFEVSVFFFGRSWVILKFLFFVMKIIMEIILKFMLDIIFILF